MSGERNERSEKGNEEERRLTERTSEDEAQRNETTPYKQKIPTSRKILHQMQILHVVGKPLHQVQVIVLSFAFCLGDRNKYRQYWLLR